MAHGIFFAGSVSCGIRNLVHSPGIKPGPSALGENSLSHWTTREVHLITDSFLHSSLQYSKGPSLLASNSTSPDSRTCSPLAPSDLVRIISDLHVAKSNGQISGCAGPDSSAPCSRFLMLFLCVCRIPASWLCPRLTGSPLSVPMAGSAQSSSFFPGRHQAMVLEPPSSQSTVTPLIALFSLMAENVISTLKRPKLTSPACPAPSNLGSCPTLCSMSPPGFLRSFSSRIPDLLSKCY